MNYETGGVLCLVPGSLFLVLIRRRRGETGVNFGERKLGGAERKPDFRRAFG